MINCDRLCVWLFEYNVTARGFQAGLQVAGVIRKVWVRNLVCYELAAIQLFVSVRRLIVFDGVMCV